jgi:hypothetical protein
VVTSNRVRPSQTDDRAPSRLAAATVRAKAIVLLQELAWALGRKGWYARLDTAPTGRPPRLYVVNLQASRPLSEHVIAAPRADGTWLFWFERGDPITPVSDVEQAAAYIVSDLSVPDG